MKIVCLVENTKGQTECAVEHGLSYYIETEKHRILMDTGASGLVLENAAKLGADLSKVDIAILSHGHYDHGGGIPYFFQVNDCAEVWMQRSATGEYFSDEFGGMLKYIGLPKETCGLSRLKFADGDLKLDDELYILSGIGLAHPLPSGCLRQRMMTEEDPVQDDYRHEQCIVITQGNKKYLFSGCAHHGILNIMDRFRDVYGEDPFAVFSGMHMMKQGEYTEEETDSIINTALVLRKTSTLFFTGHCTGERAYEAMHSIMGDQIQYMHCGDSLEFE